MDLATVRVDLYQPNRDLHLMMAVFCQRPGAEAEMEARKVPRELRQILPPANGALATQLAAVAWITSLLLLVTFGMVR